MRIIYGVSGEGLGHIFEAIEIVNLLEREGHTVKVLTYGDRACSALSAFHPTRIEGLFLYFNSRGLSLPATVVKNLHCIPFYLKNWRRLKRELLAFEPDAFLTAYEPVTMAASHLLHKPLISMDNQNELLYIQRSPQASWFDFKLAQWATRICTYGAEHYIIKSFKKIETDRKNVHFVSSLIQKDIQSLSPSAEGPVLVYLTKPNPDLISVLKLIQEHFIVYCGNKVGEDHNITYRASGPSYLSDLGRCKAIIGTTGFSLINDSIYLKKPYFGLPLRGQFEQIHNAHFLRESGLGDFSLIATKEALEQFLSNLPLYRSNVEGYRSYPAEQEEKLLSLLREIRETEGL